MQWTVYNGDNPYADFNGSTLSTRFVYAVGMDSLLANFNASTYSVAWYLTDIFGSVRQLVRTDGTVLDQISYDSFDNIVTESNGGNGDWFVGFP